MFIFLTECENGAEWLSGGMITVKCYIFRIDLWIGACVICGDVFGISLKKNGGTKVGAVRNVFI